MTISPTLSNNFCKTRTNGLLKAGVSILEIPAHYYIRMREDYLFCIRLNRLPG
jgi:hypothetical protein